MGMHHRKIKKVIIVVALIIIQCVEHQTIIAQVLNHQKLLHPQPLSQWVTPNREKRQATTTAVLLRIRKN